MLIQFDETRSDNSIVPVPHQVHRNYLTRIRLRFTRRSWWNVTFVQIWSMAWHVYIGYVGEIGWKCGYNVPIPNNWLYITLLVAGLGSVSCCELGWKYYQGSCYFFSNDTKTRQDAADYCASAGAALAIVGSREESFFISLQTTADNMIEEHVYIQGDDLDTGNIFSQIGGIFAFKYIC